jgi:hypothetical protein
VYTSVIVSIVFIYCDIPLDSLLKHLFSSLNPLESAGVRQEWGGALISTVRMVYTLGASAVQTLDQQ